MEGPVQVHGFGGWGHFASDAVHIVIVVDSLGEERQGQSSDCGSIVRHRANGDT